MTATSDTLQSAAQFVAGSFLRFLSSLGSDDEIVAFVNELGWTLPSVPASITALGTAGGTMLDALTDVEIAIDALENDGADAATLRQPLATLVLRVGDFASQVAGLKANLTAQLPAAYVTATGIADGFASRLFEAATVLEMTDRAGLTTAIAALAGLVEEDDVVADPTKSQPAFTRRRLRFDRVGPLLNDPQSVLQSVYGWGTPTLDPARLFKSIERLSYQLLGPIELRYPTAALLAALAPGGVVDPATGPAPAYTIPIYERDDLKIVIAVMPLPKKTPTEKQGVAITLQLHLGAATELALGPDLTLTVDGTLDLSSGVAAVLRPDAGPVLIVDPEGTKTVPPSGQGGARVTYANPDRATRLLTIPGGSYLEAEKLYFAAGIDAAGGAPDFYLEGGLTGGKLSLSTADADGFLAEVLPSDGVTAKLDVSLRWSQRTGLSFNGSAGLQTTLPINVSAGPLSVRSLGAGVAANGSGITLTLGADGTASIGPVVVSITGVGFSAKAAFQSGNVGPVNLALGYKSPDGVGLSIDVAGIVSGSGFLFHDSVQQQYAGAMQLSLHDHLTVTAMGVIATRLPDGSRGYSMIVFVTAEDFRPIPLGLGFTLQGIGGILGINRTFDETVLRAGLRNDTLATLLFPKAPAANAAAIIRSLTTAFPARAGSYLLGLMARIAWGTPTLVQFDLALILEIGARTRLLALGRVSVLLPTAENDLIRLKLDAVGVVDFDAKTIALDAALVDSRLVHKFAISGSGALRGGWGNAGPGQGFLLSVGGFHPRFAPPADVPKLDRVTIALCSGKNPQLICEAYLAVTTNTLQFGARAHLYAEAAGFSLVGDIGFDALFSRSPVHFLIDFHASVQLKRGSRNLLQVSVEGTLEGPRPLHLTGKAKFSILWFDFTVRFDATLVSGEKPPLPPAADVLGALVQALTAPQAWHTDGPATATHGVALRPLPPGATIVLDPLGRLVVTQDVVPLATMRDIDTFGGAPVKGDRRFTVTAALAGTGQPPLVTTPVSAAFAPAQFFALSDEAKLASPSFENYTAGLQLGSADIAFDEDAQDLVPAPLTYAAITIDAMPTTPAPTPLPAPTTYTMPATKLVPHTATGAAARAPVRQVGRARFQTPGTPALRIPEPQWMVVPIEEGLPFLVDAGTRTWSEHQAVASTLNRGRARYQVVPLYENA